jgi:hypothetical protein
MELYEAVVYRMAYGLAGALDRAGKGRSPGRRGGLVALAAEITRRLGVDDEAGAERVCEAVVDALVGRRPRR